MGSPSKQVTVLPEHSPTGASTMHRWAVCPGSVRESAKLPPTPSSEYAKDGTLAHTLAKQWWDTGREPVFPSDEMRAAVALYLNRLHAFRVKDEDGIEILTEHKFHLTAIDHGCYGTADAVIWRPSIRRLYVDDFKYGEGLLVLPQDNPQLQYYALGALLTLPWSADSIELTVVQPRIEHPDGPIRSWVIDRLDLLGFAEELRQAVAATRRPDAPLVPGEHCRFCPAAGVCPALQYRAQALAKLDFHPDRSYDPEQLRWALDSREAIKAFLKALDEFAYNEAEAGRCPPGYKLVKKRPVRRWKDEEVTKTLLTKRGFTPSQMTKPAQLYSPNQLEEQGWKPTVFDDLWELVSSGHTLAPEADPRPSVRPTARDIFGEEVIDVTPNRVAALFEEGDSNGDTNHCRHLFE